MLTASRVLDNYYLESRCMLLEIAAMLDRLDRSADGDLNGAAKSDPRVKLVYQALDLLADRHASSNRSERMLNLFSDPT